MKIKSQQLLHRIFRQRTPSTRTLKILETLTIELLASYALTQH
jgi:hypothetical protein